MSQRSPANDLAWFARCWRAFCTPPFERPAIHRSSPCGGGGVCVCAGSTQRGPAVRGRCRWELVGMGVRWTQPARALVDGVDSGMAGLWSLVFAAQHGALRLALDPWSRRPGPRSSPAGTPCLGQPNLEVDPVDPDVDVVGVGQRPLVEQGRLVLPLRGEPCDRARRPASTGAEELGQRRTEVAGGQPVQIQKWQHRRHLW